MRSDGTAEITGYNGSSASVVIPEKPGGKTVARISDPAFYKCKAKTVSIPKTVKYVGTDSFRDSPNLSTVSFEGGTERIGSDAFYGCKSLKSVKLGSGLKTIEPYVFYGCSALTGLVIPDKVTAIGWRAFSSCTSMRSVILPDSVKTLKEDAINRCLALKEIIIPYASYTYRGRGGIKPSVTVKNSAGDKLKKDTDYTVSYSDNTKVGTAVKPDGLRVMARGDVMRTPKARR